MIYSDRTWKIRTRAKWERKATEILNTFELRRKTKNYKEISLEDSQSVEILLNLIEKLQKENEKLKNIRYDTPYGTETIHLIPESNLIEINTEKYMIEVEPGKFVDLKQVYQENKKLNEYKENYIPIQKNKRQDREIKRKRRKWL